MNNNQATGLRSGPKLKWDQDQDQSSGTEMSGPIIGTGSGPGPGTGPRLGTGPSSETFSVGVEFGPKYRNGIISG